METPIIRSITKKDIPQLIVLCAEHASYEKANYNQIGKEELLLEQLFLLKNSIKCIVVEYKKELVGYVSLLKQFSTWDASFYVYMDCLYLKEKSRGKGLGRLLMSAVKKYALKEHCNLQWQTPEFNTSAIDFYKKLGAENKTKERFYWNFNEVNINS